MTLTRSDSVDAFARIKPRLPRYEPLEQKAPGRTVAMAMLAGILVILLNLVIAFAAPLSQLGWADPNFG